MKGEETFHISKMFHYRKRKVCYRVVYVVQSLFLEFMWGKKNRLNGTFECNKGLRSAHTRAKIF